ncbi:hypothetical protein [Paraburkholderia sp. MM6662-R1]|uniref:hypothetical protein n=1 Tax=Paraburkholderia sp. MM6662-R1 TaxID=2991066 RepID=UPI003D23027A
MFSKRTGHRCFPRAETKASNGSSIGRPAGLAVTISALVVCWWELIKITLDFALTDSDAALGATVGTRLIVVVSGLAVVGDAPFARPVFCFLCAMSVLAVGPAIPLELTDSLLVPAVSFIDCVTKTLFLACAFASSGRNGRDKRNHSHVFEVAVLPPRD